MDEEEEEEDSEDKDEAKKAAPKPSDVNEGKTVFLRNIPFDATPESLKMAFHDYAPVAFAIIVKDRATGMSKGTAFVKFKVRRTEETRIRRREYVDRSAANSHLTHILTLFFFT